MAKLKDFNSSESISGQIEYLFDEPERRLLNRAVVVEVIFDPSNLTEEESARLQKMASLTPQPLFDACPRNAILARIISDAKDHYQIGNARLCYPLFPPHFCLPVKAGEQVFILDPTPDVDNDIMYWIGRVPEPDYVDDINFTHADRRMMESPLLMDPESAPPIPEFPNGMDIYSTFSLKGDDAYEQIFTGSMANKSATFESVPRYTCRPGDLVLQGSNNTLICLGQKRGWTKNDRPSSPIHSNASVELDDKGIPKPAAEIPLGSGAIDIVVGRGKKDTPTAPEILKNTRDFEEVNKNPVNYGATGATDNLTYNPIEGDPDFVEDLSRIHVSMKMDGDSSFGLSYPTENEKFAGVPVKEKPYIVMKSNEVRIVGRQAGSIRIVKEGIPGDNQCVITMLADGTVAIDAKKIVIGDGREAQIYLGAGAEEPVFKGKELEKALHDFANMFEGTIGNMGVGLLGLGLDLGGTGVKTFRDAVTAALSATSFTK